MEIKAYSKVEIHFKKTVTNLEYFFYAEVVDENRKHLISVDLSHFDASETLFFGSSLKFIDLSNLNFEKTQKNYLSNVLWTALPLS